MSAVINRSKSMYRKALSIEIVVLVSCTLLLVAFWKIDEGISFGLGGLSVFLPHALFAFWIFFRKGVRNHQKMTAFYVGEVLKWLCMIVLIAPVFIFYQAISVLTFFAGCFLALLLNNLLPILFFNKV